MKADEIRKNGIPAPSNCFGGDQTPGTDRGVAENLGFAVGALQEIALQLAELNEKLEPLNLVRMIERIQAEIDKSDRPEIR